MCIFEWTQMPLFLFLSAPVWSSAFQTILEFDVKFLDRPLDVSAFHGPCCICWCLFLAAAAQYLTIVKITRDLSNPYSLSFCLLPLAGLPFPPISLPRGGDPRTQYRPISIPLISILSFPTGKASNIKTQGALALMLLNLSEWHLTEETKGS